MVQRNPEPTSANCTRRVTKATHYNGRICRRTRLPRRALAQTALAVGGGESSCERSKPGPVRRSRACFKIVGSGRPISSLRQRMIDDITAPVPRRHQEGLHSEREELPGLPRWVVRYGDEAGRSELWTAHCAAADQPRVDQRCHRRAPVFLHGVRSGQNDLHPPGLLLRRVAVLDKPRNRSTSAGTAEWKFQCASRRLARAVSPYRD